MRIVIAILIVALAGAAVVLNWPSAEQVPPAAEAVMSAPKPVADREQVIDPQHEALETAVTNQAEPDEESEDSVREIIIDPGVNFMQAMGQLGIADIEQRLMTWYKSRGFPFSDQTGTYLLDQPYEEYDDETLRAFAANDDIWAQQFLAQRLVKTRPAEALELYQKAATNGSINAMQQIAMLYNRLDLTRADSPNLDDTYRQQLYAIKDAGISAAEMSYAWSVASELAGGDPSLGGSLNSRMEQRLQEDGKERACQMAEGLYEQMVNDRGARNQGDFNRQPPPFMMGSVESFSAGPCGDLGGGQNLDYSACENVRVVIAGQKNDLVVCNPDSE